MKIIATAKIIAARTRFLFLLGIVLPRDRVFATAVDTVSLGVAADAAAEAGGPPGPYSAGSPRLARHPAGPNARATLSARPSASAARSRPPAVPAPVA